jgi:hypothetical protein
MEFEVSRNNHIHTPNIYIVFLKLVSYKNSRSSPGTLFIKFHINMPYNLI